MLKLPSVTDLDVQDKKVILRLDLDVKENDFDDLRIKAATETLDFLKDKASEIIIIGHKGRPGGKVDESLSTKPFQVYFSKWGAKVEENLRFDKGSIILSLSSLMPLIRITNGRSGSKILLKFSTSFIKCIPKQVGNSFGNPTIEACSL